ncbi:SMI1/KNR4 family protein [Candidatus Woesearchaeota archaeon]|nr:SMI1/KNR4 family protein [Candidatus Woesearchaeota archaeon]
MAKTDLYHKVSIDDVLVEITKLSKERADIILNKGASDSKIQDFEKEYGVTLPEDYKAILKYSNGGKLFGLEFYGLNDLKRHTLEFVDAAGRERKHDKIYPIADENGNPISINLQTPSGAKDGNRRDILDTFHEDGETKVIAKSFGEFLYSMIQGSKITVDKVQFGKETLDVDGSMYWCRPSFNPVREYPESNLTGPLYDL